MEQKVIFEQNVIFKQGVIFASFFQTDDSEVNGVDPDDPDFLSEEEIADEVYNQIYNKETYFEAIAMGLRFGLSYNQITAMINSVLVDKGYQQLHHFISVKKVRRLALQHYFNLVTEHDKIKGFVVLGYDGKKSDCKMPKNQIAHGVDKIAVCCLLRHIYVTHYLPKDSKGVTNALELFEIVKNTGSEDTLRGLAADGPPTNTAYKNGAIRLMETFLGRPLQWQICALHLNELNLKHVFIKIDGPTGSGECYQGVIGKIISGHNNRGLLGREKPMVQFTPVPGLVGEVDADWFKTANNDVKTIIELSHVVQSGPPEEPFKCVPGHVNSSRWVTTGSNILYLYIQTENPSEDLIMLVRYVLNVYVPMLLTIHENYHVSQGAVHYFNILQLSRSLFQEKPDLHEVTVATLKHNFYWAHPESIILRMVYDARPSVKAKGIELIQKCRQEEESGIRQYEHDGIRRFEDPKNINFEAQSYEQLIDFNNVQVEFTSPPLLDDYSLEDIKNHNFNDLFGCIPCHSQTVERFVSLTSQAATSTIGQEKRHGWLINKTKSTEKISTRPTKSEYVEVASANSAKRKLLSDDKGEKNPKT